MASKVPEHNGTYLGSQLALYQSSYGRKIGESFRECLGGCAACGLLRENFHRFSSLKIYLGPPRSLQLNRGDQVGEIVHMLEHEMGAAGC